MYLQANDFLNEAIFSFTVNLRSKLSWYKFEWIVYAILQESSPFPMSFSFALKHYGNQSVSVAQWPTAVLKRSQRSALRGPEPSEWGKIFPVTTSACLALGDWPKYLAWRCQPIRGTSTCFISGRRSWEKWIEPVQPAFFHQVILFSLQDCPPPLDPKCVVHVTALDLSTGDDLTG